MTLRLGLTSGGLVMITQQLCLRFILTAFRQQRALIVFNLKNVIPASNMRELLFREKKNISNSAYVRSEDNEQKMLWNEGVK